MGYLFTKLEITAPNCFIFYCNTARHLEFRSFHSDNLKGMAKSCFAWACCTRKYRMDHFVCNF